MSVEVLTLSPVPKAVLGPRFTLINVRSTAHDAYKKPKSLQLPALLLECSAYSVRILYARSFAEG